MHIAVHDGVGGQGAADAADARGRRHHDQGGECGVQTCPIASTSAPSPPRPTCCAPPATISFEWRHGKNPLADRPTVGRLGDRGTVLGCPRVMFSRARRGQQAKFCGTRAVRDDTESGRVSARSVLSHRTRPLSASRMPVMSLARVFPGPPGPGRYCVGTVATVGRGPDPMAPRRYDDGPVWEAVDAVGMRNE